jgi:LmbE family N-acetylglucosaminyl deacetylase
MNAARWLQQIAAGGPLPGRHALVTAHPDDETISGAAVLCAVVDDHPIVAQLTNGVPAPAHAGDPRVAQRRNERTAAYHAAQWWPELVDGDVSGRCAHVSIDRLRPLVRRALVGADVVWTHPYEAGHLDHDTAAWLVQTVCADLGAAAPVRMEFASYHSLGVKRDVFGALAPHPDAPAVAVTLPEPTLARKRAALAAYGSQAHILRKFATIAVEWYRAAPIYDFAQPAPVPASRWDTKGYQPSTAEWRRAIAASVEAA